MSVPSNLIFSLCSATRPKHLSTNSVTLNTPRDDQTILNDTTPSDGSNTSRAFFYVYWNLKNTSEYLVITVGFDLRLTSICDFDASNRPTIRLTYDFILERTYLQQLSVKLYRRYVAANRADRVLIVFTTGIYSLRRELVAW